MERVHLPYGGACSQCSHVLADSVTARDGVYDGVKSECERRGGLSCRRACLSEVS